MKRKISEARARKYLRESTRETMPLEVRSGVDANWVFDAKSIDREVAAIKKAEGKQRRAVAGK